MFNSGQPIGGYGGECKPDHVKEAEKHRVTAEGFSKLLEAIENAPYQTCNNKDLHIFVGSVYSSQRSEMEQYEYHLKMADKEV